MYKANDRVNCSYHGIHSATVIAGASSEPVMYTVQFDEPVKHPCDGVLVSAIKTTGRNLTSLPFSATQLVYGQVGQITDSKNWDGALDGALICRIGEYLVLVKNHKQYQAFCAMWPVSSEWALGLNVVNHGHIKVVASL